MRRTPLLLLALLVSSSSANDERPNVVFIMSDELAYYEVGFMGAPLLKTPRIDKMAREGMIFTRAYAASPVCAPLRGQLLTGKHSGHASVRANDGGTPLREGEVTIGDALKARGYATGGFGKWGAGGRGSTGVPEEHGFDVFFGYYDQVHAHSFYPPYLVRNSAEVPLPGNVGGRSGETYAQYEIMAAGLNFIREHQSAPFFCYLPITPPHGMYDIPADDPAWDLYAGEEWMNDPETPAEAKNYAAMVSMVDRNVGQVLDLLDELELTDNTLVVFCGDNGGQDRFKTPKHPRGYFGPNVHPTTGVEFRAGKGSLYDGGLRIPFVAYWPGKIEAGTTSDLLFTQVDLFPTFAEVTGAETPDDLDGHSIAPTLFGADAAGREQPQHDFLYWEYGSMTAVRVGDMKAVRPRPTKAWELYDLSEDVSEANDIAAEHPDLVEKFAAIATREHVPANPGTYPNGREDHEKDRRAKWGTSKDAPAPKKGKRPGIEAQNLIPYKQLKIARVSSENVGNGKHAKNAIDGDGSTLWHTQFSPDVKQHPHEIVIDLGGTYRVTGLRYLARQDGGWNGAFEAVGVSVSDTATDSTPPTDSATFRKTRGVQKLDLKQPTVGRFVRVLIESEVSGGPWASAAEIGIIGTPVTDAK